MARPQAPAHLVRLGAQLVHDGYELARQAVRRAVLPVAAAVLLPAYQVAASNEAPARVLVDTRFPST